ncbi:hypothetical protein FVEN_g13184 [Fusarium venenatum]|nr:hypothetical protein FVEN_g13184 [Fusarium venenatum]
MKLSALVTVAALSSQAISACANTWQKCEPGDANMCECNGSHIVCFRFINLLQTAADHSTQ